MKRMREDRKGEEGMGPFGGPQAIREWNIYIEKKRVVGETEMAEWAAGERDHEIAHANGTPGHPTGRCPSSCSGSS